VFEKYKDLDFESFTGLVKSFLGYDENAWSEIQADGEPEDGQSNFARRVITGLAAEQYFVSVQPSLSEFGGYAVENTTSFGCGYDFRLRTPAQADFLAVEVKGLRDRTGSLSLTSKEHAVATALRDRFFLFAVKNFHESPFHEIYQNRRAAVQKSERVTVHVSWLATVGSRALTRSVPNCTAPYAVAIL
jgi:hypothetical protein